MRNMVIFLAFAHFLIAAPYARDLLDVVKETASGWKLVSDEIS